MNEMKIKLSSFISGLLEVLDHLSEQYMDSDLQIVIKIEKLCAEIKYANNLNEVFEIVQRALEEIENYYKKKTYATGFLAGVVHTLASILNSRR